MVGENRMENETISSPPTGDALRASRVYAMAGLCLVAGLGIGYVTRGSGTLQSTQRTVAGMAQSDSSVGSGSGSISVSQGLQPRSGAPAGATTANSASPHNGAMNPASMPSLAAMKQLADRQAAPLLEKLKSDPKNAVLLAQAGAIYHVDHQFQEAAEYYGKATQVDPGNVALRIKFASSLFRSGDADGAIAQLNRALAEDPKDANALFDLGMIRLQGKQDGKGALAAWRQLLKSNPSLSADRKAMVQKLMDGVEASLARPHGMEGARSNDGHLSKIN
jgi:Tfp pilus assembly protein PilF